jgi:hypothetical protein
MKRTCLILLGVILVLAVFNTALLFAKDEEVIKDKKFKVTLKCVELIEKSEKNIGGEWDWSVSIIKDGKENPTPMIVGEPVTVDISNMKAFLFFKENDKWPDIFKGKLALGKGKNEMTFVVCEKRKKTVCKDIWAKWRVEIDAEEIVQESPEVSKSPEASTVPKAEVSEEPIKSSIPATTAKVLPKTGENPVSTLWIILGVIFLVIGGGFILYQIVANKKQQE